MANELVTGIVILRIDGRSIRSKEGAKLDMGGFEREPEYADGQLIGFSRKPVAAMVSATLVHTGVSDLPALNELEDGTLTFECDSGPIFTVNGVFATKPPSITGGKGEVEVEYCGQASIQTS